MSGLLYREHSILERPVMEFRPFGIDAQGENICDITGVIVQSNVEYLYDYVSRRSGSSVAKETIDELCRLLNERIHDSAYHVTPKILRNAWNSYSYEFGCYLREFCEILSGDPDFHFNAGRARKVPPIIQVLLRPFSVPQTYKMWAYVGSKYTKGVLEFGVGKVTTRSAILWMRFTEKALRQFGPYRDRCIEVICQSCKGGISGAQVQVHSMSPASVRDLRCAAHGDDYCEWEFTWTPKLLVGWSWFWWFFISVVSFGCLHIWQPNLPIPWMVGIAFVPTACIWFAMTRLIDGRTRQLQSLIREQEQVVDTRHEELREAYLEQQRIAVELRRKVTQLMILHRAGLLCNSTFDRELLIHNALSTVVDDLHYERVKICFYDAKTHKISGTRLLGVPPDIIHFGESIEVSVTDPSTIEGTVLLKGYPLLVNDTESIIDRLHPLHQQLIALLRTKSFISVPLKVEDRVLGAITVERTQSHVLTQDDMEIMITFANQLAIALDNFAAYREIEELNAGLEEKVRVRTAQLESANEQLQELNQLKSMFVSVVSHELRTPMTSIRVYVENMLDGLIGSLNEEQSRYLSRILFNVDRLTRLSTDLLDLSKIESGKVELRLERLSVDDVLSDIVEGFRHSLKENSIALDVSSADKAVTIHADRDKLAQIFTNLFSNAIKFTPAGGKIQILTKVQPDGYLHIRISDTGCGIASEELSKVFEKFFRGESTPSGIRGAGLGLAIVKNLVELHGGTVGVESTIGRGSTFFFTVPTSQTSVLTP